MANRRQSALHLAIGPEATKKVEKAIAEKFPLHTMACQAWAFLPKIKTEEVEYLMKSSNLSSVPMSRNNPRDTDVVTQEELRRHLAQDMDS